MFYEELSNELINNIFEKIDDKCNYYKFKRTYPYIPTVEDDEIKSIISRIRNPYDSNNNTNENNNNDNLSDIESIPELESIDEENSESDEDDTETIDIDSLSSSFRRAFNDIQRSSINTNQNDNTNSLVALAPIAQQQQEQQQQEQAQQQQQYVPTSRSYTAPIIEEQQNVPTSRISEISERIRNPQDLQSVLRFARPEK
jgi:hypothetical protein